MPPLQSPPPANASPSAHPSGPISSIRFTARVETRLRELYAEAQRRRAGIAVAFEAFAARAQRALEALGASKPSEADLDRCPLDDVYLAAALDEGAPRALELFYRENYEFVRGVSARFALNPDDAEDIAQELCAGIAGRITRYTGAGSLKGWLARVTPNVTRDHYRSGAEAWERSIEGMAEEQAPGASAPESPLLSDEGSAARQLREDMDRSRCAEMFEKTLGDALDRLAPEDRELVHYRYFRGLKGREIARIRGVAEYVVSKRLTKVLGRMEKRIYMAATTLFGFSSGEVRDCLESLP